MRIANDDVSQFLTKIAPYVDIDGARNLNRISRDLSIPYQTLRFRMLRLKDQGISILPMVNAEALGLERVRVTFDLSRDVNDLSAFFGGMHQTAGLHYYSRSMVSQKFDSEFMVAPSARSELVRLLDSLKEIRIMENVTVHRLKWKEVFMMKTQQYDYEHEQWDVDFSNLSSDPSIRIPIPKLSDSYDHMDLLIIKSMQADPWVKVVDLARSFRMTEGDVSYHMNKHVFGRRQVSGFRFKWIGTADAWSKHSILGITMIFKELHDEDARRAMAIITATPFSWNHMRAEDGTYLSELLVPTLNLPETLQYLSDNFRKLDLEPELLYPDWAATCNYTIPYLCHDDQNGWRLNSDESLGYVLQMLQAYDKRS